MSEFRAHRPASDVTPTPNAIWYLDAPRSTVPWPDPTRLEIRGWFASAAPVRSIALADATSLGHEQVRTVPRPDVEARYQLPTVGFEATVNVTWPQATKVVELVIRTDADEVVIAVPAHDRSTSPDAARRHKRDALQARLRCPTCGHGVHRTRLRSGVRCSSCDRRYPTNVNALDFLPVDLKDRHGIVHTDNVSRNAYDGIAWNIIHRQSDGLVLDVGAGEREEYLENVVYLDVVPYPTTDILAPAQSLPFDDDVFDAVFCFAVLEHVRDPFACAAEIIRVLKPGGLFYGQVPFLAPLHAYPDHYYNMTTHGLTHLFAPLHIHHAGNFLFGHPIFALSWMLNEYCAGLPDDERAIFEQLRVVDLMAPGETYLGSDFVTRLSSSAREVISCANYLIASKPLA